MDPFNDDNEAVDVVDNHAVNNEEDRQNNVNKEILEDLVDMDNDIDRESYGLALDLLHNGIQMPPNDNNIDNYPVDDGESEYTNDYSSDEDIFDDLMDYDNTSDEDAGIADMDDDEDEEDEKMEEKMEEKNVEEQMMEEQNVEEQKVEEQVNLSTPI